MVCKFRAATMHSFLTSTFRALALGAAAGALLAPAVAEKADRTKQMVVEADRPSSVDLQRQVVVFAGNAVITQGTMVIRADKVELRETPDGYRAATAFGTASAPASYRQKRDGVEETVEGVADRIEYDGRTEKLSFVGNGIVRRLRAGTLADEITGKLITWDANAELFSVQGGQESPINPGGRVRAVLSPQPQAASAPAPAASTQLTPSRSIGQGR